MLDVMMLLRAMTGHELLDKIRNDDVRTQKNAKNLSQTVGEQRERLYPHTVTMEKTRARRIINQIQIKGKKRIGTVKEKLKNKFET
jgi:hypothetical protein